jgi:hypothetical protein
VSKKLRTRIDDIALAGEELDEAQMRLAAGGEIRQTIEIEGCRISFVYTGDRYDGYITNDPVVDV